MNVVKNINSTNVCSFYFEVHNRIHTKHEDFADSKNSTIFYFKKQKLIICKQANELSTAKFQKVVLCISQK